MIETSHHRAGHDRRVKRESCPARSLSFKTVQTVPRHHHADRSRCFPDALDRTLTHDRQQKKVTRNIVEWILI